jgi:hypothetical protein
VLLGILTLLNAAVVLLDYIVSAMRTTTAARSENLLAL